MTTHDNDVCPYDSNGHVWSASFNGRWRECRRCGLLEDRGPDPWSQPFGDGCRTHVWLPPIQLCATCGAAREVEQ